MPLVPPNYLPKADLANASVQIAAVSHPYQALGASPAIFTLAGPAPRRRVLITSDTQLLKRRATTDQGKVVLRLGQDDISS